MRCSTAKFRYVVAVSKISGTFNLVNACRGGYVRMDLTVRTIRVQNQLIIIIINYIVYSNCSALLFLNIYPR